MIQSASQISIAIIHGCNAFTRWLKMWNRYELNLILSYTKDSILKGFISLSKRSAYLIRRIWEYKRLSRKFLLCFPITLETKYDELELRRDEEWRRWYTTELTEAVRRARICCYREGGKQATCWRPDFPPYTLITLDPRTVLKGKSYFPLCSVGTRHCVYTRLEEHGNGYGYVRARAQTRKKQTAYITCFNAYLRSIESHLLLASAHFYGEWKYSSGSPSNLLTVGLKLNRLEASHQSLCLISIRFIIRVMKSNQDQTEEIPLRFSKCHGIGLGPIKRQKREHQCMALL